MGFVSVMEIVKVLPRVEALAGTKPEKNPLANGWQGSEKEDCVTVWFCGTRVS